MEVNIGSTDLMAILPILILSGWAIVLIATGPFLKRSHSFLIGYLGLLGVLMAMGGNYLISGSTYSAFEGMIRLDSISVVANWLLLITTALVLLMLLNYSTQEPIEFVEFIPLILLATTGMMLIGYAENLMIIFLGIETMSIALYVLAGFRRFNRYSLEAALKYFLLGAFATGFLLYGIALLYGSVGTTNLSELTKYFTQYTFDPNMIALIGLGLLVVGFGFKVALVPFHMWTPDVYQGAPIPVTAYMAVAAKTAGFTAILRVIVLAAGGFAHHLSEVLWILAMLTMTVGNIIALVQDDVKRMLAYSSIAHAGYIMIGVVAQNNLTVSAVLFYLLVYLFTNIGAFAIASIVSGKNEQRVKIHHFAGLGRSYPLLGIAMTICMFSLAGFPPTGGFMGKFYLFRAALQSGFLWLVIIGAVNSVLSVYYYIRIIVAMYMQEAAEETTLTIMPGIRLVILIALFGIFYLGLFPEQLLAMLY